MFSPAWAPGGRLIAWAEHSTTSSESVLWVANADGADAHAVTKPIDALGQVAWLSNRELLYWANYRVYRLRLGGAPALVSAVNGAGFSVDRAATRLASGSAGCPTCVSPIQVIPLSRRADRVDLGPRHAQNSYPSLSPDGRDVVFTRNLCTRASGECQVVDGVWVSATSAGAKETQLVRKGVCPVWSPRGNEIFYAWDTGYLVAASGGAARRLGAGANCATWSPNARRLATVGADSSLSVIDADTGAVRALPAAGSVESFAWSPDSRRLLVAAHDDQSECPSLSTIDVASGKAAAVRTC